MFLCTGERDELAKKRKKKRYIFKIKIKERRKDVTCIKMITKERVLITLLSVVKIMYQ